MVRNEQDYRAALDSLRFSNEAKERMMKNLTNEQEREQAPTKRRNFHPLRAGLMAACLCLALVGTAFAAATVYRLTARTYEKEYWGEQFKGYEIYGEPVTYSLEDFTREFQDDFAAWDHPSILFNREFDTWEEAKAYLGDKIPAVWHSMDGVVSDSGYRVEVMYNKNGDGKVQYVEVYNNVKIAGAMTYNTEVFVYTPDYSHEWLTAMGWPTDWEEYEVDLDVSILDNYTMANGCVAEVILQTEAIGENEYFGAGTMRHCTGAFLKDGLLYKVELVGYMNCTLDDAGLEAQMHQILDSFQ